MRCYFPFPSLASSLIPTSTMHTNFRIKVKKRKEKKETSIELLPISCPVSFLVHHSKTEVGRKACTSHLSSYLSYSQLLDRPNQEMKNQHELRLAHLFRAHRLSYLPPISISALPRHLKKAHPQIQKWGEKLPFRREQQMSPRMLPSRLPAPAPARNPPQIR